MTTVNEWTGRETRALRHALRLTVRAFAQDLGVSVRAVSKWESGGTAITPRPELQAALDTMLHRATAAESERFTTDLERANSTPQLLSPDAHGPETTESPLVSPPIHAYDAVRDSASEAAAFAIWWETSSVSTFSVDVLFSELRRLAAEYLDEPPEPVILAVRDIRDRVFALLKRQQSPSRARDLHLAAGFASVLLALFSSDLGQLGAAGTHAQAGALFVETSGSAELKAWVQTVRSKTSFLSGDYRAAAEQAAAGLAEAPPTEVRVLLAAQAADAWATMGAPDLARDALEQTAAARLTVTASDTVGGLLSCNPAREANYLSGVYQCIGSTDQAVATADQALSLSRAQPVRSYATEAQIRLNLVDTFLNVGDIDAAAEAFQPVFLLTPERRLHTLTRRVGQLGDTLAVPRFSTSATVQGLREQIVTFTNAP